MNTIRNTLLTGVVLALAAAHSNALGAIGGALGGGVGGALGGTLGAGGVMGGGQGQFGGALGGSFGGTQDIDTSGAADAAGNTTRAAARDTHRAEARGAATASSAADVAKARGSGLARGATNEATGTTVGGDHAPSRESSGGAQGSGELMSVAPPTLASSQRSTAAADYAVNGDGAEAGAAYEHSGMRASGAPQSGGKARETGNGRTSGSTAPESRQR